MEILKKMFDSKKFWYTFGAIFVPFAGNLNGSLLFALTHVVGFWLILYWMYRKKIHIKL